MAHALAALAAVRRRQQQLPEALALCVRKENNKNNKNNKQETTHFVPIPKASCNATVFADISALRPRSVASTEPRTILRWQPSTLLSAESTSTWSIWKEKN